jgi:hypothetical protein
VLRARCELDAAGLALVRAPLPAGVRFVFAGVLLTVLARALPVAEAPPLREDDSVVAPVVGAGAPRAAVLRALERCGRVRGRFERTPSPSNGALPRPLLSLDTLTRTSLLKDERAKAGSPA